MNKNIFYYAQIDENNIVINIVKENPEGRFESSIKWYPCSPTTQIGDIYNHVNKDFLIQTMPLNKEKEITLNVLKTIYSTKMKFLTKDYDEYEISTWPTQIEEAKEYLYRNVKIEDLDFLPELAKKRFIDVTILAKRVLHNAKLYKRATGGLTGERQAFEDKVLGAINLDALIQIRKEIQEWQDRGAI